MHVIRPGIGIECGVSGRPYAGASKLIGSRSSQKLDLSVAASQFGIDRRDDDAQFAYQVRIDERGGLRAGLRVPGRAAGVNAITLHIDLVGRQPRKRSTYAIVIHANARHQRKETHQVVADNRQVRYFLLREHFANGGTRSRQQCVRGHRDFDGLRLTCNLQREVQAHLRCIAELDIGIRSSLKAGQFRLHCVDARQETSEVVHSSFVAEDSRNDAGAVVRCCNGHARQHGARGICNGPAHGGVTGLTEPLDLDDRQNQRKHR